MDTYCVCFEKANNTTQKNATVCRDNRTVTTIPLVCTANAAEFSNIAINSNHAVTRNNNGDLKRDKPTDSNGCNVQDKPSDPNFDNLDFNV